ncbi:hypothetical protein HMPREF3218_0200871 [Prevotella bivia]|nr:hypothetical protein HMPREF3218_0200871 [Prevotella bivia]
MKLKELKTLSLCAIFNGKPHWTLTTTKAQQSDNSFNSLKY